MFASFFVPFYFFQMGMSVPSGTFSLDAVKLGLALTLTVLPVRIGIIWLQRRFIKGEAALGSLRVAAALAPTLIFTLVLAGILRERFGISDALYGALLVYAGISTMLPSLVLAKPIEFDVDAGSNAAREAQ
jgi:Kef-type K+ transport system membrane component KefB